MSPGVGRLALISSRGVRGNHRLRAGPSARPYNDNNNNNNDTNSHNILIQNDYNGCNDCNDYNNVPLGTLYIPIINDKKTTPVDNDNNIDNSNDNSSNVILIVLLTPRLI